MRPPTPPSPGSLAADFRRAGWTVRGDLQVVGEPDGSSEEAAGALARHFAVEASGRWKTTTGRAASAVGLVMGTGAMESEFHSHREAQLFYLVRGEVTCESARALWIVPPQSALWIPADAVHKIKGRAPLEGYSVFVEPGVLRDLPPECCAIGVSPLLRELLVRLASRPRQYDLDGPDARLVSVLLDELASSAVENHRLPMPVHPKLRRLVAAMIETPGDTASIDVWARRIGVGARTLSRLVVRETGLTFGRWRQQLHVILAIQRLSRGAAVQEVAGDLGYESASSFVTMFRRAVGDAPARYMAARLDADGRRRPSAARGRAPARALRVRP